jgi:hypothetical protein
MPYGTYTTLDTLAASQQTVAQFGEDNAFLSIDIAVQAHNALLDEKNRELVEFTTDRLRRYGGAVTKNMTRVDQFGRASAQKMAAGDNVGFPLYLSQITTQWTRKALQVLTAAELAADVRANLDADTRDLDLSLRNAIFSPTNNTTYADVLVDNVTLPLRALVNADGASIPPSMDGVTTFNAATHTHYLFTAGVSLAAADVIALIETVIEHYNQGEARLYINRAQEAAVRALTNFSPYIDQRVLRADTAQVAAGALDPLNLYNRAIGIYNGAEVYVKPWIPSGYLFAFMVNAAKPLAFRTRTPGAGLELVADDEKYPLRAKTWEREYGVSVWNRTNGAVLYIDTGAGGAYVAPTLT